MVSKAQLVKMELQVPMVYLVLLVPKGNKVLRAMTVPLVLRVLKEDRVQGARMVCVAHKAQLVIRGNKA